MRKGKKITILGAGNVGASIAYTLTMDGMASEIVLIDINEKKAQGEAADILQGTPFSAPVNIHAGGYEDAVNSDIVIVTVGMARKPGQTRIDLAQANVDIVKSVMPQITRFAPDAVYVVVSNPVDIITYAILKTTHLSESQVVGSGTMLDSARLRSRLAAHVGLNSKNVHAYVFGEHGDTSMIPWSLATIAGMEMDTYCSVICDKHNHCGKEELREIEDDVRTGGGQGHRVEGRDLLRHRHGGAPYLRVHHPGYRLGDDSVRHDSQPVRYQRRLPQPALRGGGGGPQEGHHPAADRRGKGHAA